MRTRAVVSGGQWNPTTFHRDRGIHSARHSLQNWSIATLQYRGAWRRWRNVSTAIGGGRKTSPVVHLASEGNENPRPVISDGLSETAACTSVLALYDNEGREGDASVVR